MEWSLRVYNYSGAGRLMEKFDTESRHKEAPSATPCSTGRGGDVRTREQEKKGKRQRQQIRGWIILSPSCVGRLSLISLHKLGKWRWVMKLGFWGGGRHAYSTVHVVCDE